MRTDRQEYKKRAKDLKRVYFHFEIDRKYGIPSGKGGSHAKWATITLETAEEIQQFINKLEKEGKI